MRKQRARFLDIVEPAEPYRVTVVARQICAHMTSDRVAAWKKSFRADSVMANDLDLVITRFVSLRTAWEASGR